MKLTLAQHAKRWFLTRFWGSYTHPDGTIELDIDHKAGVDPTVDDDDTISRKHTVYAQRQATKSVQWQWMLVGAVIGGSLVYWWMT